MKTTRSKPAPDRGAASDLWRRTLSQIPSSFGRLVYLASLRNQITGKYDHHGLALVFGEREADRALRESHVRGMNEWLAYSLEEQKADLDLYLSGHMGNRREVLEYWVRAQPYKSIMPAVMRDADKRLYVADLEAILSLLRHEYGVCVLGQGA